jgi:hypothetical protein
MVRAAERNAGALNEAEVVGFFGGTNTSIDSLAADLERSLRETWSLTAADGVPAVILVPGMTHTATNLGRADERSAIMQDVINRLRAENMDIRFIDYMAAGLTADAKDGVHYTTAGYGRLTDFDIQQLRSVIDELRARPVIPPAALPPEPAPAPPTPPIVAPVVPSDTAPTEDNSSRVPSFIKPVFSFSSGLLGGSSDSSNENLPKFSVQSLDFSRITERANAPVQPDTEQARFTQALTAAITAATNTATSGEVAPEAEGTDGAGLRDLPVVGGLIDLPQQVSELDLVPEALKEKVTPPADVTEMQTNFSEAVAAQQGGNQQPATPAQETPVPVPEVASAEVDFTQYYTIENDVLDDSRLQEFIRSGGNGLFKFAAVSDKFPEGEWVRFPDSIPGMPYTISEGTTNLERFTSVEGAAKLIVMIEWAKQNGTWLSIHDLVSDHDEHSNAGDMDIGVLPTPELQKQFAIFMSLLRRLDNTPETSSDNEPQFHHAITGDTPLQAAVRQELENRHYRRPNIIVQENHGTEPDTPAHIHWSMDGGKSGPFLQPAANVGLNESGTAPLLDHSPLLGSEPQEPAPAEPETPNVPDESSSEPAAPPTEPPVQGSAPVGIQITNLLIDWDKVADVSNVIGGGPEEPAGDNESGGASPDDGKSFNVPRTPDENGNNEEGPESNTDEAETPPPDVADTPVDEPGDQIPVDSAPAPTEEPSAPEADTPLPAETSPTKDDECLAYSFEVVGNERGRFAWDFYVGQEGWTPIQAAGMLGNLQGEGTNFDPEQVEIAYSDPPHKSATIPPSVDHKGRPGYGIIQWTTQARKDALQQYSDRAGTPVNELATQLGFSMEELMGPFFDSTLAPLMNAQSPEEAAEIITRNYEIPSKIEQAVKKRQQFALDWYNHCANLQTEQG